MTTTAGRRRWRSAPGWLVGVALGMFTYAVMAVLRDTSLLSRLIATLALLSAAQSAMLVIWTNQLSAADVAAARSLDRHRRRPSHLAGPSDPHRRRPRARRRACGLVYSGTLFGLATSAVSENRRVAAIARWAPNRIEFVNYVIAGFLSALAAILLAPIVGLNATILSIAILPALAAALVGRFSSFALTVAAALVIGVIQSELSLFQPDLAHAFGVSTASLTGSHRSGAADHHPDRHRVLGTGSADARRDGRATAVAGQRQSCTACPSRWRSPPEPC